MKRIAAAAFAIALAIAPAIGAEQSSIVTPTAGPHSATDFTTNYLNPALRALLGCNWGPSAPANGPSAAPALYECWADTTTNPVVFKVYDGTSWAITGKLNSSTHLWTPSYQGTDLGSASTATAGTTGHVLGFLDGANTYSGVQSFNDGKFALNGLTSGATTVKAPATGGGTATFFAGTDTIVGRATTDTLSNKTLSAPIITGGVGITGNSSVTGIFDIVSANAAAFSVGPSGGSNPAFNVDASTASLASGWNVKGAATGGPAVLSVLDSGTNSAGQINAKGTGTLNLQAAGTTGAVTIGTGLNIAGSTLAGTDVLGVNGTSIFNAPIAIGSITADGSSVYIRNTISVSNVGGIKSAPTFTGTNTNIAGIFIEPTFVNATVTTFYGLSINGPSYTTSTATNFISLRIGLPTGGSSITQAIYTEGAGKVGIGALGALAHFHLNDNAAVTTPPSGTAAYFAGLDNGTNQIAIDAFGTTGLNQLIFRRTRGTGASPNTALAANDNIMNLIAEGNDGGGYTAAVAGIAFIATSAFTTGPLHPTAIIFSTATGNFAQEDARFNPDGSFSMSVGGTPINTALGNGSLIATDLYSNDASFVIRTKTTLTNGAAAAAGTLTNAPAAGNPTKWVSIDDNGTTRRIPAW